MHVSEMHQEATGPRNERPTKDPKRTSDKRHKAIKPGRGKWKDKTKQNCADLRELGNDEGQKELGLKTVPAVWLIKVFPTVLQWGALKAETCPLG